jgi:hypothetical protein
MQSNDLLAAFFQFLCDEFIGFLNVRPDLPFVDAPTLLGAALGRPT